MAVDTCCQPSTFCLRRIFVYLMFVWFLCDSLPVVDRFPFHRYILLSIWHVFNVRQNQNKKRCSHLVCFLFLKIHNNFFSSFYLFRRRFKLYLPPYVLHLLNVHPYIHIHIAGLHSAGSNPINLHQSRAKPRSTHNNNHP